jgi:hypothetical protein
MLSDMQGMKLKFSLLAELAFGDTVVGPAGILSLFALDETRPFALGVNPGVATNIGSSRVATMGEGTRGRRSRGGGILVMCDHTVLKGLKIWQTTAVKSSDLALC